MARASKPRGQIASGVGAPGASPNASMSSSDGEASLSSSPVCVSSARIASSIR
eukprot:CAMPEP_0195637072 /NCGR_PEP_ID=MMETSP0815-20121206/24222_1 /TAXON_ID=97485 /ORGANISM="Prymnesium parvum, Strain Texoma1" /LENGTH=52 /DNA_ID=CAMNT_0040779253 /DNA_START=32 /DNA_END=186 /DNA_ORIENTATION=-